MDEVKISKAKLLEQLKKNREDHTEIFEAALIGWKETVLNHLDKALAEAREGSNYRTYFNLPMPENHTKEYDEIIARVEWHEDEIIELDLHEFPNICHKSLL